MSAVHPLHSESAQGLSAGQALNFDQGSQDWHAHRSAHANASEAPVVMDVSPWEPDTWFKLWQAKTGRIGRPATSMAMQHGIDMEGAARTAYEKYTGNIMQPMVMGKNDWLSASLDGISFHGDLLLEIKCPVNGEDSRSWQQARAGEIPLHYYWQIQHQLYVSDACAAHLWMFDGTDGFLAEVLPELDNQQKLLHAWRDFWTYIATDSPPPLTDKDTLTRADDVWATAATAYRSAKDELKRAEVKAEQARTRLIGLASHPKVAGAGVTVTKYWQQGRINYGAIPELKEIDIDRYRSPAIEQIRITTGEKE